MGKYRPTPYMQPIKQKRINWVARLGKLSTQIIPES
jgi:hypothetical protein